MFKVGEKVKIKTNAASNEIEDFTDDMEEFKGKTVTLYSERSDNEWKIEEDGAEFYWHESWFEKIQTYNFKNIEKII